MPIPPTRAQVLGEVAELIPEPSRPLLVAVDGVDGSGKTIFADELGRALVERGDRVVRAGVDSFHLPRQVRHGDGRTSESVWTRHFDYRAMRRELLDPWLRGYGDYRRAWHDVDTDAYLDADPEPVPEHGILLVDGVFTQRPELRDAWDLTIFLDVPFEVSIPRMAQRDGSVPDVADPDQQRYIGAQELYFSACAPRQIADVVVDNADWAAPVLVRPAAPEPPAGWTRQGDDLVRSVRVRADRPDLVRRLRLIDEAADG